MVIFEGTGGHPKQVKKRVFVILKPRCSSCNTCELVEPLCKFP